MAILAPPQGLNPCPWGHEFHKIGRRLYNKAFSFTQKYSKQSKDKDF